MDRGAGFIIGDQTGIGKGRVVAGVIRYAMQKGKTPIFVTEKPNLYADMYRDLSDIGMSDFRPLMTNSGEKVPLDDEGRKTLKTSDGKAHAALLRDLMEKGSLSGYDGIFTTYNQMQTVQGKGTVRQEFLRAFARDGFVIFDESHNAGGTEANERTKEGKAGLKEGRAGFARGIAGAADAVFYSSATYAKRPSVMDLYFKTDMRLAVDNITKLGAAIAAGGVPLQQAVAAMLTRAGQYIRRERSFDGINYNTVEATVDRAAAETFSTMLREINVFDNLYKKAAVKAMKDQVKADAKKVTEDGSTGMAGVHSTNFTSIMHNLIEQFLLALKVKPATALALEHLKAGEKVVLTVANTMGSFMKEFADDNNINNGDAVDLSFRDLLVRYLDSTRRVHIKDAFGKGTVYMLGERDFGPLGWSKFQELKEAIHASEFGDVPISPIDYIRSSLKRAGYDSDEITGRGSTLDYSGKGHPAYKVRPGKETSIAGRRQSLSKFNNGKTSVLVLNQAGATGLSLHASSKFADKRKRRMIVVQAEKNIDTHMQMLGRINRTGQVVLPEYDQLVADIPAEKRPAAVLSKKMASLNANTTGARGGAMTAKDTPDFMNDYGDEVVARLMSDDPDMHRAMGAPLERDEKTGEFSAEEAIRKVTGRIPLLKLADQEEIYDLIESEYQQRVALADAMGENMLEAKTLPLEAETRSRVPLFDGKGASPFQEPSHLELVVAKRTGKPYTPKQLAAMIRKELGLPDGASEEDVTRAATRRHDDALKGIESAYGSYLAEQTIDEEDQRKVDTIKARMRHMRDRVESLLETAVVGRSLMLSSDLFQLPAIVTKVEKKGTTKNPVGLGAWKATFALPDAARHVTLSFRDLGELGSSFHGETPYNIGNYAQYREYGKDPERAEEAFEHAQSQSREVRYIATGNMLAAFSKIGRGSIVNYSTNKGEVKQGILLPKNFEPKEGITKAQEGFDNADQVLKYFGLADRGRVTGKGGDLTLLERGSEYWLAVPKSKERGGEVYLDEQMRDIVGNFVSAGNSMRARFDGRNLGDVVKRLYEQGITLIAESDQEAAQKAKGKTVDETTASLEKMGLLEEKIRAELRGVSYRRGGVPGVSLSSAEVRDSIAPVVAAWKNGPKIAVVPNARELPPALYQKVLAANAEFDVRGVFEWDQNNGYLVASNLESVDEAQFTLFHEALGHYGLRRLFGANLNAALETLAARNENLRAEARTLRANFKYDAHRSIEEALADMAGRGVRINGWDKFIAKVQQLLRELGFGKVADWLEGKTQAETLVVLAAARRVVTEGAGTRIARGEGPLFSRRSPATSAAPHATLRQRAQSVIDRIDHALEPIGRLPDRVNYLKDRYRTQGVIKQASDLGRDIYDVFAKASDLDRVATFRYMTTRDASPGGIEDPAVREQAQRAKALILDIGEALVDHGMLSREVMESRQGAYLPQLYMRGLIDEADWTAFGAGKKPSKMGYLKERSLRWRMRDDGTVEVLNPAGAPVPESKFLGLGPIGDPGFLASVAVTRTLRDMALLDWLSNISRNTDWVLPKSVIQWEGQRVTPWWLKNEAARIRRQADHYDATNAAAARDLADRMDRTAADAIDALEWDLKDWRQMPDTLRYGRLRGLVVRREIYEDIVGTQTFATKDSSRAEQWLGYGGHLTKATQFWKAMKVSMNPPSQVRNAVSNMVLLHLSGVAFVKLPLRLGQAVRAMRTDGEAWQIAKRYGINANTFAANELIRIEKEMLDLHAKGSGLLSWTRAWTNLFRVMNWASDKYQTIEALFKTAKIIDELAKGKSPGDAVIQANKWLFDYSLVSQSVRYLRNAPIGAPFLTWTVKVLPRLMEVALHAPYRFLPYAALAYTMPLLATAFLGIDDDDQDKLKKLLPKYWQDKGNVYVLPAKDRAGRFQVVDLSYFMPWGQWEQAARQIAKGEVVEAIKSSGFLGGPVPDLISAVSTGKDPFTGRDIVPKGSPPLLQYGAMLTYAMDMALPTFLSSHGIAGIDLGDPAATVTGALPKALSGETNKFGDPVTTVPQAVAKMGGVTVRSVDPVADRAMRMQQMQREIQDSRLELRRQLQDQALSPAAREKLTLRYTEEVLRRAKKLQEFERDTRLSAQ